MNTERVQTPAGKCRANPQKTLMVVALAITFVAPLQLAVSVDAARGPSTRAPLRGHHLVPPQPTPMEDEHVNSNTQQRRRLKFFGDDDDDDFFGGFFSPPSPPYRAPSPPYRSPSPPYRSPSPPYRSSSSSSQCGQNTGETCSWTSCSVGWCDTTGWNECRYPSCSPSPPPYRSPPSPPYRSPPPPYRAPSPPPPPPYRAPPPPPTTTLSAEAAAVRTSIFGSFGYNAESGACNGFGVADESGVCDYSTYQRTSMIRCSGDRHFERWMKAARKRKGKKYVKINLICILRGGWGGGATCFSMWHSEK